MRKAVWWAFALGVASACLGAPGAAQQPPPVFASHSELVVLHVSVVDRKSGFVSGLPQVAFRVYEDGRPQQVSLFRNEDSPATIGLVIDCSGSMRRKRDAVIAAGLAFAKSSHPQDEMFTINFNERVWPGLPDDVPFTNRLEELRDALQRSSARGETALFDGVRAALRHLDKGRDQKKVLIVVSDGGDNASASRFDDLLNDALRMNAVIYSIGLYDEYDPDAKPGLLRKLASATGGEAFFPRDAAQASQVLEGIAKDIRSGYTLAYVPPADRPEGFRRIRVDVRTSDGRHLAVRARSGYLAGKP
jgi:Ca-activated chloride channel homolog